MVDEWYVIRRYADRAIDLVNKMGPAFQNRPDNANVNRDAVVAALAGAMFGRDYPEINLKRSDFDSRSIFGLITGLPETNDPVWNGSDSHSPVWFYAESAIANLKNGGKLGRGTPRATRDEQIATSVLAGWLGGTLALYPDRSVGNNNGHGRTTLEVLVELVPDRHAVRSAQLNISDAELLADVTDL